MFDKIKELFTGKNGVVTFVAAAVVAAVLYFVPGAGELANTLLSWVGGNTPPAVEAPVEPVAPVVE